MRIHKILKSILQICVICFILSGCKKNAPIQESILPGNPAPVTDPLAVLSDKKDIIYANSKDTAGRPQDLLLDIYFPPGATFSSKYPLVMLVHGGGYVGGDKNGLANECRILADSGFVAVSINYRLGWKKNTGCSGDTASLGLAFYRGLQDANAAIRFLVCKSAEYAIDTDWIFIGGASAGGNVAMNLRYITQAVAVKQYPQWVKALGNVNDAGNNLTNDFSIKGICQMWGGISDSTLITPALAVPTISFHGTADKTVPYDHGYFQGCVNYPTLNGSMTIYRRTRFYNKPSIVHLILNGGHDPAEFTPAFMMSNAACFFKKAINNKPVSSKVVTGLLSSCR